VLFMTDDKVLCKFSALSDTCYWWSNGKCKQFLSQHIEYYWGLVLRYRKYLHHLSLWSPKSSQHQRYVGIWGKVALSSNYLDTSICQLWPNYLPNTVCTFIIFWCKRLCYQMKYDCPLLRMLHKEEKKNYCFLKRIQYFSMI